MSQTHQKKLDDITIAVNRLTAQKAQLTTALKKENMAERRARTRTLIQLGGLLTVSGLLELFDILPGDDLELDSTKSDNGATLLGCLITVMEQMPTLVSNDDQDVFKRKGIRALTQRNYAKREQHNMSHA